MITIVGIPLAILLLLLYILSLMISIFITSLYVGKLVLKKENLILAMLTGLLMYIILTNIPIINFIVGFLAVILGLGAIITQVFKRKRERIKINKY